MELQELYKDCKVLSSTLARQSVCDHEHLDYHDDKCVPSMSYSLRDLVKRFSVGTLPTEVIRSVMYTDNPDFDSWLESEDLDFDIIDARSELSKLRELHALRMERRKAVDEAQRNKTADASTDVSKPLETAG